MMSALSTLTTRGVSPWEGKVVGRYPQTTRELLESTHLSDFLKPVPSGTIPGNPFVRPEQQASQNIDLGARSDTSMFPRVTENGDMQRRNLLDNCALFQRMAGSGTNRNRQTADKTGIRVQRSNGISNSRFIRGPNLPGGSES